MDYASWLGLLLAFGLAALTVAALTVPRRTPPLRAPHHTATRAAVIGGGSGLPRPGDVSLAHRGVLLLDEASEFPSGVLDYP